MERIIVRSSIVKQLGFLSRLSCLTLLLSLSALAQTTTSSDLLGVVTDPQGLPVVAVDITVTEIGRGYTDRTATNEEGFYRIKGLLPGTYQLKAEMAGFQTFINENVIVYT